MANPSSKRISAPRPKSFAGKPAKTGLVCTFYSYKGGVGRSMALANVAALLSKLGQRVLVIDWDLEAPGLDRYFGNRVRGSRQSTPGLLDLIKSYDAKSVTPLDWRKCLLQASIPQGEPVDIIHAGLDTPSYASHLQSLDWDELFANNFGEALENLRRQWKSEYDYVLIDSRTGITDTGGVCSILLPDYLISLFTTNEQSLLGVKDVMSRARAVQKDLPLDRQRLVIIPIAARDESNTEYARAAEWRKRFARELADFYDDWIHKGETAESVLDYLKIPYVAFWSFGESLPALEEDPQNPKTLAYSYALIARLIHSRLDWSEVKDGRAAAEAKSAREAEAQARLAEANRAREEALAKQEGEKQRRLEERQQNALYRFDSLQKSVGEERAGLQLRLLGAAIFALAAIGASFAFNFVFVPDNEAKSKLFAIYAVFALAVSVFAVGVAAYLTLGLWRRDRILRALERERAAYAIESGAYSGLMTEMRIATFAERIEQIFEGGEGLRPDMPAPGATNMGYPAPNPPSGEYSPSDFGSSSPPSGSGPTPTGPGPLPAGPDILTSDAPIDVFISTPMTGIARDWALEFAPLFDRWLSEMLGRDAAIADTRLWSAGTDLAKANLQLYLRAHSAVLIVSRRHLNSDFVRDEWRRLMDAMPPDRIFCLKLESFSVEDLAPELARARWIDFSDVAYVGEAFSRSERYIVFQDRVRGLAQDVAKAIRSFASGPASV